MGLNHPSIGSSNVDFDMSKFNSQKLTKITELFDGVKLHATLESKKTPAVDLLIGSRDKSPKSINTAY